VTLAEFSEKVRKGFGKKIPLAARQIHGAKLKDEDFDSIWLRYDWIKDKRFWKWASDHQQIDFDDGQEWIRVFLYAEE
jgi:hypothetical protein